MGLEMRGECGRCGARLAPDGEAYICVHECTFCRACFDMLARVCADCGGELVRRPRPRPHSEAAAA